MTEVPAEEKQEAQAAQQAPVSSSIDQRRRATKIRLYLTLAGGLALCAASWFWGRPTGIPWLFPTGLALGILGLFVRLWATGWLVKDRALTTTGPYAIIRHPLYLGTFLLACGQALMSDVLWAIPLLPALCLVLYVPTMNQENKFLEETFGEEFRQYAAKVPSLFPSLLPGRRTQIGSWKAHFNGKRIVRHLDGMIANALILALYVYMHIARS